MLVKNLFTLLLFVLLSVSANLYSTEPATNITVTNEALFESVKKGDISFSETFYLIDNGADVNATDAEGNTPLHYAHGRSTIILLLKHNANLLTENNAGELPIQTIMEFYTENTISPSGWTWKDEAKNGKNFDDNKDLFQMLIEGVDVNDINKLIYAFADNKCTKPLEWLLSLKKPGLNINATFGMEKYTALQKAASEGLVKNAQLLLDKGADDYMRAKILGNPRALDIAKEKNKNSEKYNDVVKTLQDFDENGAIGKAGIKEAELILLDISTNYDGLSHVKRIAYNNLMFRYIVYVEKKGNINAAKLIMDILSQRSKDLSDDQKEKLTELGDKISYSLVMAIPEFNREKFILNAKEFLDLDHSEDLSTKDLASLCIKKITYIFNSSFLDFTASPKKFFRSTQANILVAPNSLIDYLYYRARLLPPGERPEAVFVLEILRTLAEGVSRETKNMYNYSIRDEEIKTFVAKERVIDPVLDGFLKYNEDPIKDHLKLSGIMFEGL